MEKDNLIHSLTGWFSILERERHELYEHLRFRPSSSRAGRTDWTNADALSLLMLLPFEMPISIMMRRTRPMTDGPPPPPVDVCVYKYILYFFLHFHWIILQLHYWIIIIIYKIILVLHNLVYFIWLNIKQYIMFSLMKFWEKKYTLAIELTSVTIVGTKHFSDWSVFRSYYRLNTRKSVANMVPKTWSGTVFDDQFLYR